MNSKKYYTPNIEEFYIGFECEFKNDWQTATWEIQICDWDLISIAFDTNEHEKENFKNEFRVKYLDKEDIESLGWKFERLKINNKEMNVWKYGKYIITSHVNNTLDISHYELILNRVFRGTIKNKSELKKLMKQLNIT